MNNTDTTLRMAFDAWEDKHHQKAFQLFLTAANEGNAVAQHNLGFFYDTGLGIPKDARKALIWYKRAWKTQGGYDSCTNIAKVYSELGRHRTALRWWHRAVRTKNASAALEFAKYLLKKHPAKQKILALIKIAAHGRTSVEIAEDGKTEAAHLLQTLTSR